MDDFDLLIWEFFRVACLIDGGDPSDDDLDRGTLGPTCLVLM